MEIFLFIALVFIYILTAFAVPDKIVKRVWFLGFGANLSALATHQRSDLKPYNPNNGFRTAKLRTFRNILQIFCIIQKI